MSADWDRAPIGDLCHLINGRAFKPSDWSKRGLPIVRIQNLNDPTKPYNHYDNPIDEKYIIENGDILLSWSGTPGTSFGCFLWNRGRALLNQHIFKVHIDNKRIDAEFFVNAINYRLDEMIAQAHGGVGLRHITKKKLESIEIPLPSLPEQRRIVARIKEMVARVDEIRKLREEALKKAEVVLGAIFHHLEIPGSVQRVAIKHSTGDFIIAQHQLFIGTSGNILKHHFLGFIVTDKITRGK